MAAETVNRALVLARPPPDEAAAEVALAAARVRALLEEVARLDAEVEAFSRELDAFTGLWERSVGAALADLLLMEKLVRRLQAIEDEVARLDAALRSPPAPAPASRLRVDGRQAARRTGKGRARERRFEPDADEEEFTSGDQDEESMSPEELLPEAVALKRLWRRLARILHPDLAGTDAERQRLSGLMAVINAAYEKGDLAALELMAERLGAGEDPDAPSDAERLAHLARREGSLLAVRQSLGEERARLEATDTARLRDEVERRRQEGGDLLAESSRGAEEEAAAARADALARFARLFAAARELAKTRRKAMDPLARRGAAGALRPFDPVAESALVRRGAALLDARRATGAARELARSLEERAGAQPPWEAALTLLAFFAEAADEPPESLAGAAAFQSTWEELAAAMPGAPDLPHALARLPRHLALGLRAAGGGAGAREELAFGVHLTAPELVAGIRVALGSARVREVARRVLAGLGPRLACAACGVERRAVHLLRVRGLDELHGLVCPECGALLRSYWQYGKSGGLEALSALAVELRLVARQVVRFAGAALALEMLPAERARLTGGELRRRIHEVTFAPYKVPVEERHLVLRSGRRVIGPRAAVPAGRIAMALEKAPLSEAEALDLLRARIERRFRE